MTTTKTKNVIYLLTFTKLWDDVARHLQRAQGWNPVLFVGEDPHTLPTERSIFHEIPYYNTGDARRATLPKHVANFERYSLDAPLLDYYANNQSIAYELMTRFIPNAEKSGYDARRVYYWELIRIWEGLFQTLRPDIVAAASFPHRIFDYIIYLACERRKIPYISIEYTSFPYISYPSTSISDMSAPFRSVLLDISNNKNESSDVDPKIYNYMEKLKNNYSEGKPKYYSLGSYFNSKNQKSNSILNSVSSALPQELQVLWRLARVTIRGQLLKPLDTLIQPVQGIKKMTPRTEPVTSLTVEFAHIETIQRIRRTVSWYRDQIETVDKNTPFIYFSANFQPERSTVPDAGYFHDYQLILDILEQATPKHWNVYYKEHPHSFHRPIKRDNPRSIRFYKRLQSVCPRLRFLAPTSDPFELIDNAEAVALARGTAAWEAVARGKQVLSFGNAWYDCCPGIHKVRSVEDCVAAYRKLDKKIDDSELKLFLLAVENVGSNFEYYTKELVNTRARMGGRSAESLEDLMLEQDEYDKIVNDMSRQLVVGVDRHMRQKHPGRS